MGWNQTKRIDDLISAQVLRAPRNRAVWDATRCLTYEELDRESTQVAAAIVGAAGPGVRTVAVAMERSLELVVAIVAVLRLGATYFPIEPAEPSQRRRTMLADRFPDVLVTRMEGPKWQDEAGIPIVSVTLGEPSPAAVSRPVQQVSNDAAYLLFTSGSTGKPKGVLGRHDAITTRLAWMNRHYPLREDDVFVLKTAVTFVDSLWDIFHPLTTGHGLAVLTTSEVQDPALFVRRLTEEGVTRLSIVPAHLDVLLRRFPDLGRYLSTVRILDVTGEAFTADLLERTVAAFDEDTVILNRYGTTEVPSALCFDARRHDRDKHGDQVPIGTAISGTRAWVAVDDVLRPPRPGLNGELCVAGAQVALGYLDAALTEERFVDLPKEEGGETDRVYRTGDIVTVADDLSLCFAGRADRQVQLGGRRVDPQEVEAALLAHPAVDQVVVFPWGMPPAATLAAVYSAKNPIDHRSLLAHLNGYLPVHMVPTVLRRVAALPTLPSGKTDRLATAALLNAPTPDDSTDGVTALVARLLPGVPISPQDRLVSLGADSLLAMRLVVELRQCFGVDLTPRFVLGKRINELTAAVTGSQPPPGAMVAKPLERRAGTVAPLAGQQALFHRIDRMLGQDRHAYHDLWTLHLAGSLGAEALLASTTHLAVLHPVFRTALRIRDGVGTQQILDTPVIDTEFHDLAGLTAVDARQRIVEIKRAAKQDRFDLTSGESLRIRLIRLADDHHLLGIATHHITNDAWSGRLLNRSLTAAYRAISANREPPTSFEEYTYADYAWWQQDGLTAGAFDDQLEYWCRRLAGVGAALPLRTDRHGEEEPRYLGGTVSRDLPPGAREAARRAAAEAGVSEFTYHLAVYSILIAREVSESDDIVIGTPTALRQYAGLLDTVGFFANMLVYRMAIAPRTTFSQHLDLVNELCLEALNNQEVPFLTVLNSLGLSQFGPHPVTNVTFAMPNVNERIGEAIQLRGVQVRVDPTPAARTMSKFDLSLSVHTGTETGRLTAIYRDQLFRQATVERLLDRYVDLLLGCLRSPSTRLS